MCLVRFFIVHLLIRSNIIHHLSKLEANFTVPLHTNKTKNRRAQRFKVGTLRGTRGFPLPNRITSSGLESALLVRVKAPLKVSTVVGEKLIWISQVAVGMSALYETSIYYCFELNGVLEDIKDKNSVVKHIDSNIYKNLLDKGIIADGMLPKLENCFDALRNGVKNINMGNTSMLTQENDNFTKITL